jgi:large subunit ribosomal protein L15
MTKEQKVNAAKKRAEKAQAALEALLAAKIVRKELDGLKVLGAGELTKKLTVKATVFSASAKEKIEAAGGQTEEV